MPQGGWGEALELSVDASIREGDHIAVEEAEMGRSRNRHREHRRNQRDKLPGTPRPDRSRSPIASTSTQPNPLSPHMANIVDTPAWGVRRGTDFSVLGERVPLLDSPTSHQDSVRQYFAPRDLLERYKKLGNRYHAVKVPTKKIGNRWALDIPTAIRTALNGSGWQRVDMKTSTVLIEADIFDPDNDPHVFYRKVL